MEVAKEDMGAPVRMVRNRRNSRDRLALRALPNVVPMRSVDSLPPSEASLSTLGEDHGSSFPSETTRDRVTAGRRRLRLADWEHTLGLTRETLRDTEGAVASSAARLVLRVCEFAMQLVAERGDVDGARELLPRAFAAARQADDERERRFAGDATAATAAEEEEEDEESAEEDVGLSFVASDAPPLEAEVWSAKAAVYLERSRQLKRARDAAAAKMSGGVVGGAASGVSSAADGRSELEEAIGFAERAVDMHVVHARRLLGRQRDAELVLARAELSAAARRSEPARSHSTSWAPHMATASPAELFRSGLLSSGDFLQSSTEHTPGWGGSAVAAASGAPETARSAVSHVSAASRSPRSLRPGEVLSVIAHSRAHLNLAACLSTAGRHGAALAHADTARRRMRRLLAAVWGKDAAPAGRRVDSGGVARLRRVPESVLAGGSADAASGGAASGGGADSRARRLLRSLGVSVALAACFNAGAELEHLAQPWLARMRHQEGVGIAVALGATGLPVASQLESAASSLGFAKPATAGADDAADDDDLGLDAPAFLRGDQAPSLLHLVGLGQTTPRGDQLMAPVTLDPTLAGAPVSQLRRASVQARASYQLPSHLLPPDVPRQGPHRQARRRRSSVLSFLAPVPHDGAEEHAGEDAGEQAGEEGEAGEEDAGAETWGSVSASRAALYGPSGVRPRLAGLLSFTGAATASEAARRKKLREGKQGQAVDPFRPLASVPEDASVGTGKSQAFDGAASLSEWMEREKNEVLRKQRLAAKRSRRDVRDREREQQERQIAPDTVFVAEQLAPALAPVLRAGLTPLLRNATVQPSPDLLLVARRAAPATTPAPAAAAPLVVGNVGATLAGTRNAAMPLLWWRMAGGEDTMRPTSPGDLRRRTALDTTPQLLHTSPAVELAGIGPPHEEEARRRALRKSGELLQDQVDAVEREMDPRAPHKPRLRPEAGGVRRTDGGWQILMQPVRFAAPAQAFAAQSDAFGPHDAPVGRAARREAAVLRATLKAEVAERERDDLQLRIAMQDAAHLRVTERPRRDADRLLSIAAAAAAAAAPADAPHRSAPSLHHGVVVPAAARNHVFDPKAFQRARLELQSTLQDLNVATARSPL